MYMQKAAAEQDARAQRSMCSVRGRAVVKVHQRSK